MKSPKESTIKISPAVHDKVRKHIEKTGQTFKGFFERAAEKEMKWAEKMLK